MSSRFGKYSQLLPWLVGLALLAFILIRVSPAEAWHLLRQLDWRDLLLLLAANVVVMLIFSARWWLILRRQGYSIGYLTLAGYRLGAFGVSYFTPGPQFGGEPLQVILPAKHDGVPHSTAISAVSLEKALELLVNFGFLALGLAVMVLLGLLTGRLGRLAMLVSFISLALPVLYLLGAAFGRRPLSTVAAAIAKLPLPASWQGRYAAMQQAIAEGERQTTDFFHLYPRTLLAALLVSLLSWAVMLGEYWLALHLLGETLEPVAVLVVMTAGRMAYLAALPGGLGALEASQVLALGALGLNPALGISLSALIRGRDVIIAGLGLWWGARQLRRPAGPPQYTGEQAPASVTPFLADPEPHPSSAGYGDNAINLR